MSHHDHSNESSVTPPKGHAWINEVKGAWRTSDKARYDYCVLESDRHIRLLHITIDEHVPLPRLKIINVPLDSAPAFEALSYCWGDDTKLYQIPIETDQDFDTRSIPSTDSVATAMVFVPRSCSTRYIWIDQICINQEDDNEKGQQIALMGEIYSTATRVLVWLGPGLDLGSDKTQTSVCSAGLQPVIVDDLNADLEELMGSDGLHALFNNNWFQRAWVVQESCLAREKQVLIGKFSITWWGLLQQIQRVVDTKDVSKCMDVSKFMFHLHTCPEWGYFEEVAENNKPRVFCGFLARYSQRFMASDPKDKVLAFFGLWKPPSFDTKAATRREETTADVYTRFATSLIKDTKGLDILAAVDHTPGQHERDPTIVPSWVPQWGYTGDLWQSPLFQFQSQGTNLAYEWNTSRSRNHQYRFNSPTAKELHTLGRILWKIGCVAHRIMGAPPDPDNLEKTKRILGLHSGARGITVSDALRILFLCKGLKRTVKFTDFEPGLRGPRGIGILRTCFPEAKTGSGARHQIEGLPEYDGVPAYDGSPESENAPSDSQEHSYECEIDDPESLGFACLHAFYNATRKRFFNTQWSCNANVEGVDGPVGLGPGCIEMGDEIAILHGADFPVVLRKLEGREQRYQFVGDCYLDGVMFGEAVDWEEKDADDIIIV
ncbi:hypothetical protein KVR01_009612 [Diaporthe batatas]|uniref:uncharacterized protein n=1 Tax=Diaporthe batatas TaxID=748121 RepID=UPI001D05B38C|nr:uncharacterized protein KVR01_009612 [Diaporthe batatas]KAG8161348.1 hypothetical protein KVR01_009612 [Diaporthe batatas]